MITNNQYIVGEKSKGYAFSQEYDGQALKEYVIVDYRLSKAIKRAQAKYTASLKKNTKGYDYLTKWCKARKLEIDHVKAFKWIDDFYKSEMDLIGCIVQESTKKKCLTKLRNKVVDYKEMVLRIKEGRFKYRFAGDGNRFYNGITNLKRELRNFLTYDGRLLVEVDIRNSQPFMSLALLNPSFWEKTIDMDFREKLSLRYLLNKINKVIKYNPIIMLLKTSETQYQMDFQKYKNLVLSAKFYDYIKEQFQPWYGERFSVNNKVKVETLRIMYSDPDVHQKAFYKPCLTFKSHFPGIYKLFTYIQLQTNMKQNKTRNYLPTILQKIESFLMLDVICKNLGALYPELLLLTVHDSILTTKGNEAIVADVMRSEIHKWMGYEPKVKTKDLLPSNVELKEAGAIGNKKIVNTCTGELFDSIEEITAVHNIKYETLISYLNVKEMASSCWKYAA